MSGRIHIRAWCIRKYIYLQTAEWTVRLTVSPGQTPSLWTDEPQSFRSQPGQTSHSHINKCDKYRNAAVRLWGRGFCSKFTSNISYSILNRKKMWRAITGWRAETFKQRSSKVWKYLLFKKIHFRTTEYFCLWLLIHINLQLLIKKHICILFKYSEYFLCSRMEVLLQKNS